MPLAPLPTSIPSYDYQKCLRHCRMSPGGELSVSVSLSWIKSTGVHEGSFMTSFYVLGFLLHNLCTAVKPSPFSRCAAQLGLWLVEDTGNLVKVFSSTGNFIKDRNELVSCQSRSRPSVFYIFQPPVCLEKNSISYVLCTEFLLGVVEKFIWYFWGHLPIDESFGFQEKIVTC